MKKLIFILLLIPFIGIGQTTGRLSYTNIVQSYHGDTIKSSIGATYAEWYTNLTAFSVLNDFLVNGNISLPDNDTILLGDDGDTEQYFDGTTFTINTNNNDFYIGNDPAWSDPNFNIIGYEGGLELFASYNGTNYSQIEIKGENGNSYLNFVTRDGSNTNTVSILPGYTNINRILKTPQALTSATSIAINMNSGYQNFTLSLAHNATITFSNLAAGDEGKIYVTQNASAPYTFAITSENLIVNNYNDISAINAALSSKSIVEWQYDGANIYTKYWHIKSEIP